LIEYLKVRGHKGDRHRSEAIKMGLGEMFCEEVNQIKLAQGEIQWKDFANIVINLQVL
jgi:hypothetical protein